MVKEVGAAPTMPKQRFYRPPSLLILCTLPYLVGRVRFGLTKLESDGFTDRLLWPLAYLPIYWWSRRDSNPQIQPWKGWDFSQFLSTAPNNLVKNDVVLPVEFESTSQPWGGCVANQLDDGSIYNLVKTSLVGKDRIWTYEPVKDVNYTFREEMPPESHCFDLLHTRPYLRLIINRFFLFFVIS